MGPQRPLKPDHRIDHLILGGGPVLLVTPSGHCDGLPDPAGSLAVQSLPFERLPETRFDVLLACVEAIEEFEVALTALPILVDVQLGLSIVLPNHVVQMEACGPR